MVSWLSSKRKESSLSSFAAVSLGAKMNEKSQHEFQREKDDIDPPENQSALLLRAISRPYELTYDHPIPKIKHDHELLVKVVAVGLNPIDWKAPYACLSNRAIVASY